MQRSRFRECRPPAQVGIGNGARSRRLLADGCLKTPSFLDDESVLWFRGGVPVSYRAGPLRVDAGAFVPVAFRDWWLGLSTACARP